MTEQLLPSQSGYRWPAEWEPHVATWLSWPHNRNTWPGAFEPIPRVWQALVEALSKHELVRIVATGDPLLEARQMTGHLSHVEYFDIPTNDSWARDHGPIFLQGQKGSRPLLLDFEYNAWGGKYPPFDLDNQVPKRIAERLDYWRISPGIVLEGGSLDGNGLGTILTSEQCLLNPNRNPGLSRPDIERYLADYLSARKVIWLGNGIEGDDTDGHIDELARFVSPRIIVAAIESDPAEPNFEPLQDNLARLLAATDQDGRPFEVVPLALPSPLYHGEQRLPACYLNFYIANDVVIVPTFGIPEDQAALGTLSQLFPGREVIALYARDLVWGLGAFHCITQQQPKSIV